MLKMVIGLSIGMLLMGLLYNMGILSPIPSMAQTGDSSLTKSPPGITEIYHEAFTSPLQEAGAGIQDNDIAQFYQKLLRGYGLDKPSSGITPAEYSGLAEILPDIEKINRTALTLPLEEAGENIQDRKIAGFYYGLLKDAGWAIEPN